MSQSNYQGAQQILAADQALIPQSYKKTLQSKALMEYYQENSRRKMYNQKEQIDQRIREFQHSQQQNQRHLYELQMKRQIKEHTKNQYSKVYDQMINQRKERQQEERQRQLWLERTLLNQGSWLKDTNQQKQLQKQKKQVQNNSRVEYAKLLEQHLKMQQDKRIEEALKIKQIREKNKRQSQEKLSHSKYQQERKGNSIDFSQQKTIGVKDTLVWSNSHEITNQGSDRPMTPRMQRMLKLQQQKFYDKGSQIQYKSQGEKRYYQSLNPQRNCSSLSQGKGQAYNPITNPIPYHYRNPSIMKFISRYS